MDATEKLERLYLLYEVVAAAYCAASEAETRATPEVSAFVLELLSRRNEVSLQILKLQGE